MKRIYDELVYLHATAGKPQRDAERHIRLAGGISCDFLTTSAFSLFSLVVLEPLMNIIPQDMQLAKDTIGKRHKRPLG